MLTTEWSIKDCRLIVGGVTYHPCCAHVAPRSAINTEILPVTKHVSNSLIHKKIRGLTVIVYKRYLYVPTWFNISAWGSGPSSRKVACHDCTTSFIGMRQTHLGAQIELKGPKNPSMLRVSITRPQPLPSRLR